ncbi:16S rRNA (guanine(527)-N(7))-methyltransferase RsmG [Burkholderiaceae bacterium FT117]|uniref:16S rRNA (guanine(527)-N(7))-methyltransferase RsmG n=1 Tax=Zeimonas sediminis TaxID=2944268 RepID=UPI002343207D|nr:16S rRNA (guanine(527)-N(7))-methyltransferase RsmG [Zeimonas sediminis]MCM5571188.1 16S rRNA (guanine(527)-N(7))-methyltransferase RsmG [Zeimonas sediminis]
MSSHRPGRARRQAPSVCDRDALEAELKAGVASLGLVLPQPAIGALLDYLALLAKWNAVYNLTAVRDPRSMLVQHLLDSLAIVGPLSRKGPFRCVVDVGSGGGLPGIVLAIVWPDTRIHLVEPVGKKAAFLRQCAVELALAHVEVHATHVESLEPGPSLDPDLIVCRAFASLADFAAGIERLAGPTTIVAAMKGVVPHDEIAALPEGWSVAEVVPLDVPRLDAERHLLLLDRRGATACGPAGA